MNISENGIELPEFQDKKKQTPDDNSSSSSSDKGHEGPIPLSRKQIAAIEAKVQGAEKDIEQTLEETEINVRGVTISLIVSIVFIILCLELNPSERVALVSKCVKDSLEKQEYLYESKRTFVDINSQAQLDAYFRNILIPIASNEYINHYNYIAGMRFTLKLAQLEDNPYDDYSDAVPLVKENPSLDPGSNNDGESHEDLGLWEYSSSGGYLDAGGYVQVLVCSLFPLQCQGYSLKCTLGPSLGFLCSPSGLFT